MAFVIWRAILLAIMAIFLWVAVTWVIVPFCRSFYREYRRTISGKRRAVVTKGEDKATITWNDNETKLSQTQIQELIQVVDKELDEIKKHRLSK